MSPGVVGQVMTREEWTLACLRRERLPWGRRGNLSITPHREITELLESGVDTREIVRRMVATGDWSEAGAADFVSFLAHGPDAPARPVRVDHAGRRGD